MKRFLSGAGLAQAPGPLSNALLSINSIDDLRAYSPLPDEAQRLIDTAVVSVGLERLTLVADLYAAGLTFPLADPLSVMELYWERDSKIGHAKRMMLPNARGENQLVNRDGLRIPIYATVEDFNLNVRTLRASLRAGTPLDTSMVAQAVRRVNESIEDAAINGAGLAVGGNTAYGILTHPNANTQAYSGGEAWTAAAHDGEDILGDVLNMVDALQADNMFGPYRLYVNTTYGNKLNEDFKANSDKTILQRLQEMTFEGQPLTVRVADRLPANYTALVQMTSNVVDVIDGQQPTVISWASANGMEQFFMVLAFVIPRIKAAIDGTCGICVGNLSF